MHIERFAPSPTGLLHLGHAFSALTAWEAARMAGGRFLLRFEDLDAGRVRPAYKDAIRADLQWLGLDWPRPELFQSSRINAYKTALDTLNERGLLYRCTCARRDIAEAVSAPQEGAAVHGPDGLVYPGTCREADRGDERPYSLRLNMARAIADLGGPDSVGQLWFEERGEDPASASGVISLDAESLVGSVGDIVLRRRDGAVAYHLAVVVDDAFQQISHVTRGSDLFAATQIHRVLQALLALPVPVYAHHRLIRDEAGRRLAKRDDARAISTFRDAGATPEDIRRMIGL